MTWGNVSVISFIGGQNRETRAKREEVWHAQEMIEGHSPLTAT